MVEEEGEDDRGVGMEALYGVESRGGELPENRALYFRKPAHDAVVHEHVGAHCAPGTRAQRAHGERAPRRGAEFRGNFPE